MAFSFFLILLNLAWPVDFMVKPRLCFTLLYADGYFHVSRNFDLQLVGNLDWLVENYEFDSIARAIDELIILNVSRGTVNWEDFIATIQNIARHCFMPIAVGGGVRTREEADRLFANGADKVVLNSAFVNNPALVSYLVSKYGAQSIVASLDFKRLSGGTAHIFIENGAKKTELDLPKALARVMELGAGEIYLTSMDRDGTGQGYDLEAIELAYKSCNLPLIVAGGADTYDRLAEGIKSGYVSAVSTSHLFNFMCDGLKDTRESLILEGIGLSEWDFEELVI